MRICTQCKAEKELSDYYPLGGGRSYGDGRMAVCKNCFNANAREKYKNNIEAERERAKENSARYRASPNGREKISEYKKSELGKQTNKRYAQSEKGVQSSNAAWNRRRAILQEIESTLTTSEWREIIESYSGLCVYCNKKCERPTQDHIIALTAGGTHTKENVVPACGSCNSSKNNKPLIYWMAQKVGFERTSYA